jgi:hypothetical protein
MTPIGIGSGLRSSVAGLGDDSEDRFARVRLLERVAGLMLELVHDASVGEDSSYSISAASALSPHSIGETGHQETVLRAVREMAYECPPSVWLALAHTNTFQVCRAFPNETCPCLIAACAFSMPTAKLLCCPSVDSWCWLFCTTKSRPYRQW